MPSEYEALVAALKLLTIPFAEYVEKEIERRGDNISKITFGITREETKKFYILKSHF